MRKLKLIWFAIVTAPSFKKNENNAWNIEEKLIFIYIVSIRFDNCCFLYCLLFIFYVYSTFFEYLFDEKRKCVLKITVLFMQYRSAKLSFFY